MKRIALLILIIALLGCYSNSEKNNRSSLEADRESVSIDTVKIKETEFKNYGIVIDKSEYPQIKGLLDSLFQLQINDSLRNNFDLFLSLRKGKEELKHEEMVDDLGNELLPSYLESHFSILNNNSSILSIVQYFSETPFGGGNAYKLSAVVTNIDLKNKKFIKYHDLNVPQLKIENINRLIESYFTKYYKDAGWIDDSNKEESIYPTIDNMDELNNQKFGIHNDSLIWILESTPLGYHATYGIYEVPIGKWIH